MHPVIIEKLLERKVIRHATEIVGFYRGMDLCGARIAKVRGTFTIVGGKKLKSGKYIFSCINTIDGSPQDIASDEITEVDGMDPDRVAAVYGYYMEGDRLIINKRKSRLSIEDLDDED